MGVCRKRSTTSVPAALSISYLMGSPPIGTSIMTLTSSGGLMPTDMASMRMEGLLVCGPAPQLQGGAAQHSDSLASGPPPAGHRDVIASSSCQPHATTTNLTPGLTRPLSRPRVAAQRRVEPARPIVVAQNPAAASRYISSDEMPRHLSHQLSAPSAALRCAQEMDRLKFVAEPLRG